MLCADKKDPCIQNKHPYLDLTHTKSEIVPFLIHVRLLIRFLSLSRSCCFAEATVAGDAKAMAQRGSMKSASMVLHDTDHPPQPTPFKRKVGLNFTNAIIRPPTNILVKMKNSCNACDVGSGRFNEGTSSRSCGIWMATLCLRKKPLPKKTETQGKMAVL